jgi:hypothetical protein
MTNSGQKMEQTGDVIEERILDGRPLTTYAQFVAELAEGRADAGVVRAPVNLTSIMGGFHRFYGTEAQQRACSRYRQLWDASQVGGARAVDPSREPVDGGWLNPEAVFEIGADARKLYGRLTEHLGRIDTKRLHFVVVGEWGPTPYAKWRYGVRTPNNRHVADAKVEVREIAEKAAAFLDLITQGNKSDIRTGGDKPGIYSGEISTRKVA